MEELKLYGNYYKIFKGGNGIPEKITVIAIKRNSDKVTIVKGHYAKENLKNQNLKQIICSKDKIITKISPEQQKMIAKQKEEFQENVRKIEQALWKLNN